MEHLKRDVGQWVVIKHISGDFLRFKIGEVFQARDEPGDQRVTLMFDNAYASNFLVLSPEQLADGNPMKPQM